MNHKPDFPSHLFLKKKLKHIIIFFFGFASLIWFFIRVIPKPSRASYPCMQAAFPMASAFVLWLSGIFVSGFLFTRAKAIWQHSKYMIAFFLFLLAICVFVVTSTSLKYTPALAKTYIFAGKLAGESFPVMNDQANEDSCVVAPAAVVSIVKSNQAQAEDIDYTEIVAMVSEAIEKAGGLEGIVGDGDTVILKPNLVCSTDGSANPQQLNPEVNGVTTDYRVVQAVVNIVRELNPSGKIYILEGSALGSTANNMAILNYDQITGIDSLICLDEASGAWGDTTSQNLQGISLPPGKALYAGANNRYWLHKLFYNADVVISIPVLKNHLYAGVTGSVKNVGIGATPPTIYAYSPGTLRWKIDHDNPLPGRANLHYFIHDFFMCRPADFVVMDGLQSIQNGPASTATTQHLSDDQMNMRLILAGKDPVAVDAIGALLMGHDPELIPHLVTLHNDSLGCCDSRLIRVSGNMVGDEKKDFEIFDSGVWSKYNDFEAPSFMVDECYSIGDDLHFKLTTDDEVSKVEVSIDGLFLSEIVICGFNDFSLDLNAVQINIGSLITVYAYDRYLNYSRQDIIFTADKEREIASGISLQFNITPNPGIEEVFVSVRGQQSIAGRQVRLTMIDLQGHQARELAAEMNSSGKCTIRLDVSGLPAAVYLVRLQAGGHSAVRKVVVR